MSYDYINARPPQSDSDDDYDGFSFGDDFIKKERRSHWVADLDQELYDAVSLGDLDKMRQQIEFLNFKIDSSLKSGLSLLHNACRFGHLDIVRYLIEDMKANVNQNIDSYTPLMCVCECKDKDSHIIEKIVLLLLKHGAIINVSDKFGTTPFINACRNGHTAVVRHMIDNVSFDAVDNHGCTPIFHAIENNHIEIVKILVKAGVNCNLANGKGYTPIQVAEFHGFYDLLDILPKPKETYLVPTQYITYNKLCDYIPRIFLKPNCPEYFQEIHGILRSLQIESLLDYFAKGNVPLVEFLSMNDKKLAELGIIQPIYRQKIMKGLLDYHLHHWTKKSIAHVEKNSKENFYEILMLTANHLQNLVVITAALRFIKNNLREKRLGPLTANQFQVMQHNLRSYSDTLKDLKKTVKYLASFSPPKNPLYIDYDEYLLERKRRNFKAYFKYTTILIGISVAICLKFF